MRLISRYVLQQLVAPFLFALAAMTSIFLLNQVAQRFGALVGKGLPAGVIAEVFGLSIPFIFAMTLPMAVLFAVLHAFSHLASDNEITAMRASGVSIPQLLAPVLVAGLLTTVFAFGFNDQVLPRSNARLRTLLYDIARKKPTFELREQVINALGPSGMFLRASRIDPATGRLRGVTLYDLGSSPARRIIYADSGRMALTDNQTDLSLRLFDGAIHEFKAMEPQVFQLTYFRENEIWVKDIANQFQKNSVETARGDREMSTCEMLGYVRQNREQAAAARREQRDLLRSDLRTLLLLPPPPPSPPPAARRPGGYCGLLQRLGGLFTPKTAEAQEPAQHPARRPLPPGLKKPQITGSPRATPPPQEWEEPAGSYTPRLATWPQVANAAERVKTAGIQADKYLIEVHKKLSISAACAVFVLIGIPLALRFPRGGMGLVIGGGLAVFSVYYVGLIAGEALGDRGLVDPAVAMWGPNMIFTFLGLLGLRAVNRTTGTERGGELRDLLGGLLGRLRGEAGGRA